jgi:hypothetical protein
MNSRLKGHHIYAFAGLVSLVWVGVGTWLRWAPVYVFSEVAVAFFLFVLALISKERYENNLRRSERKRAKSIYRRRSRVEVSREPVATDIR